MKRLVLLSILLITSLKLLSQDSDCFEKSDGLYWPLNIGIELKYTIGNDTKFSTFENDSIEFDGEFYLIENISYISGENKIRYWREENGAIYSYDKEKREESLELPSKLKVGKTWKSTDKTWTYKIVSLESDYSTPFCEFSNLLEVETESTEIEDTRYNLFYKKGVGLIGLNVNDKTYTYIVPNREMDERSFIAYGCENEGSKEEISACTQEKISMHIYNNFKPFKRVKKGVIYFVVVIGADGEIEEVNNIQNKRPNSKEVKEAIRVIKSLPKFIPAQVDTNQPIRTSIVIPVRF